MNQELEHYTLQGIEIGKATFKLIAATNKHPEKLAPKFNETHAAAFLKKVQIEAGIIFPAKYKIQMQKAIVCGVMIGAR